MELEVNGVRLYYEKAGEGAPLFLLHGNGESHEIFDKAVPLLAKRFTVYAVDTRGHGKSQGVDVYHYDDMAADVVALIGALHLQKPALYGFSDGGIVGLLIAIRHPDLLSALVVSGANTAPNGLRLGWQWFFGLQARLTRAPQMVMMMTEPHITPEMLGRIRIPVTVLAGRRDMVSEKDTRLIADSIPMSRLQILKGEGHDSYIIHQEKIARLILDALGA